MSGGGPLAEGATERPAVVGLTWETVVKGGGL
jgi:hypothetical protein